jgi:hypothetical protein
LRNVFQIADGRGNDVESARHVPGIVALPAGRTKAPHTQEEVAGPVERVFTDMS